MAYKYDPNPNTPGGADFPTALPVTPDFGTGPATPTSPALAPAFPVQQQPMYAAAPQQGAYGQQQPMYAAAPQQGVYGQQPVAYGQPGVTTTVVNAGRPVYYRRPYIGPITWLVVLIGCLFIGPFSLLFLLCPLDST